MEEQKEKKKSAVAATPGGAALRSFVAGGFGGMCLVAVGHPFDLIKVRLQTTSAYTGLVDCFKKTVTQEGIRGLYKGMSTPLFGVAPVYALCFWGYDIGQKLSRWGSSSTPLTMNQIMFAGGFSAIPTTVLMTPSERIKCLLQVQSNAAEAKYKGPVDACLQVLREGGVRSLYRGTVATLLRDVPGSVAYFGVYEAVKAALTPSSAHGPASLSPLAVVCAGGLAGIAFWPFAIPADVLKSRLQTAPENTYKGLLDVFRHMMRTEGPTSLFRGLGPVMVRAFPANAACFLGVEVCKKAWDTFL